MTSQVWAASQSPEPTRTAGETRWLDADEQKAWRAWLYSSLLLQDRLDRELTRETGISHAYYEILVALSEAPDRMMRMSELADRCLSSRSRLSHAVSRLEERGWGRPPGRRQDGRGPAAGSRPGTVAGGAPSSPTTGSPLSRRPPRCTSSRCGHTCSTSSPPPRS